MPAVESRRWTAEAVRALPDEPGRRFECVDGELLVSPGPRIPHQWATFLLQRLLFDYGRQQGLAAALAAPAELELDTFTLVQPDVFVLPLCDGKLPQSQQDAAIPLLFVEVLSPSTARFDRITKRQRYQRDGVEYWIVDLDARLIERWMPDADRPEIAISTLNWQPTGAAEPLVIPLDTFFAEVHGER